MIPKILKGLRVLLLGMALAAVPAYAESVTAMFAKAQKSLKEGKTKVAYKSLLTIVRRYPDHEPSHLLLGHILYRSGQVGRAYKHFKRISPELVPPDLGYEYGITMFQAKKCTKAIQGFAQVPSTSKFGDLARFYRGICYLRSRQYQKAEYYLSHAKNLPANLVSSRRQALAEVREQARRDRQGGFGGANPYLIVPTPPPPPRYDPYANVPPPAPAGAGPPAPAAPKKPDKPPPPPPSGLTNVVTPAVTITQKTLNQDFFGMKQSETETDISEIKGSLISKYTGEARGGGGQPYASLPIDVGQIKSTGRGDSVSYKAYSDDPSTIIEERTQVAGVTTTTNSVKLQPLGDYPVGALGDVSVNYLANIKTITTSDNGRQTKSSELGPGVGATIGDDSLNVKLTFAHTVVTDERVVDDGDLKNLAQTVKADKDVIAVDLNKAWESVSGGVTVTKTDLKIAVTGSAFGIAYPPSTLSVAADIAKNWESFSLTGTVTKVSKEDQVAPEFLAPGETSSLKYEVSGTRTLSFGGNIGLTATMVQLDEYRSYFTDPDAPAAAEGSTDPVPKRQFKATGTEQTVLLSFRLQPLDWAFGVASYSYKTRAFTGVDPKVDVAFKGVEPEISTELTLQVGLSKSF